MDDWKILAGALRSLHAALLRRARTEYVARQGLADDAIGPGELLMLATRDESFAWLRSLSELMAEIDELQDSPEAAQDPRLRAAVRRAVEDLLTAPADDGKRTPFQESYWAHVPSDPEVTMAHAAVRRALHAWPADPRARRAAMTEHLQRLAKAPRS
jgi:hypothetical protein